MSESQQLWMEKNNPYLHVLADGKGGLCFQGKMVEVSDVEVVVLDSVDSYDYKHLLEKGKIVVLVEKEEEKVYSIINQKDFFFHDNLYVVRCREEEMLFVAKKLLWKSVAYIGDCAEFKAVIDGVSISVSEYRDLGEKIIPNICRNLLHQEEYIDGRDVASMLEGEEVAVFGNGISIGDGIDAIKKMKKRPYIIACGSSLSVLVKKGIVPDFFAAIDPDVDMTLYKCLDELSIPMFYQNKVCSELFYRCKGPKIFMGSAKGWDIESSLLRKIEIDPFFFDAGYNAGNFGAHIALTLGCKKVFLIGMDGVSKEGEEKTKNVMGLGSRADLLSGMEFFKELLGHFKEQEIYHFTKGFSFSKESKVKVLDIAPKKRAFVMPMPKSFEGSKEVITRFFSRELDSLFKNFFAKEEKMTKERINYALAEISLFPIYQTHLMQMFGIYRDFFEEEVKDPLFQLIFFKNVWDKIYKQTGVSQDEDFMLFGRKEGRYKRFDKNGTMREEGNYFLGKLDGCMKKYDEQKKLISSQEMRMGLRCGKYAFYKNEKCIRKGQFINDRPDGVHETFKDAIVVDRVCYENGKKAGVHSYFNDAGILIEELFYHGDVFDRKEFTDEGEKTYIGIWDNKYFIETFYKEGKVTSKRKGVLIENKMVFEEMQ